MVVETQIYPNLNPNAPPPPPFFLQVAARLAGTLSLWRKFELERRNLMKAQLDRLAAMGEDLSKDTQEIVQQSLLSV
jgi:hypothetical protein